MRGLCLAGMVALGGLASADWWTGVREAARTARSAAQQAQPGQKRLEVKSADRFSMRGDALVAEGNVHLVYGEFEIFGDKVTGDRRTEVFKIEGQARLTGPSESVVGETIEADLKNGTYRFEDGTARLGPQRLEKSTSGDVYVTAKAGAGTPDDFDTVEGSLTTCSYDSPHFVLEARTTRVRPGRRAELRDVRLKVLGRTVLGLPFVVVPLTPDAPKYIPEVGQSPDEGTFVKTRLSTPLPGESYIDHRIDLMSRLGVGLGADWNYIGSGLDGVLSVYGLTGTRRSLTLTSRHGQKLGAGRLSVDGSFQRENYLTAPESTLWNIAGQYLLDWGGGSTRFGYTRVESRTTGFETQNQTASLADSRAFGSLRIQTEAAFSRNDASQGTLARTSIERLDVRWRGQLSLRSLDAELLYQRSLPVGSSQGFFSASDRTPMLSLTTTSARLFGGRFGTAVPLELGASVGELSDPRTPDPITRLGFDALLRRSDQLGSGTRLDWGGRFQQGLYSDDTAQYVLAYDASVRQALGRSGSLGVNYRYLRPFGFTPLGIDSTGRNDAASLDLSVQAGPALSFSAATGYDILLADRGEVPWQQLYLRSSWRPGQWAQVDLSAVYDTFNKVWGTLRLDSKWRFGETRVSVGAAYDGRRSQWAGLNAIVEAFRIGRVTANAIVAYNGYTSRVDAQQYQLVYDMHCTEAVFELTDNQAGFRSGRTFAFYLRIKALPAGGPFGVGRRGESVGSGFGFGR
jgi:hypothetical protein